jgi:hypothetical protein
MELKHRWVKSVEGWDILCIESDLEFDPKCEKFKFLGLCPFCNYNAKSELEIRKTKIKERVRIEKFKKELQEKNTIKYYLK